MHPLIADGGEMTVLRDLAAFSYGRWSVDWPESVPEDQRPELPDGRDFGYASKLKKDPGRFGRRFVRADVTIKAQDFDEAGKPIPFSGESDVEETLDDAAKRTDGDVFFEREITRAGLGALVPRVDFDVDSVVPVLIWGKTIPAPVTSIEDVVEQGAVVDYRVHVGGQLLQDDAARERANREVEATIAQERRERVKAVSKERKARTAAIASESRRSDAYADAVESRLSAGFEASYERYSKALSQLGDTWRQELQKGLSAEQRARVEALRQEQQAREKAGTDLRGELEKSLGDAVAGEARARQAAIANLSKSFTTDLQAYGELVKEAKNYVDPATKAVVAFWSPENQNKFNQTVQLWTAAQAAYNDVNDIKWVSQDAWNEQQQKINEARAKFEAQQIEINTQRAKFEEAQKKINELQSALDQEQDLRLKATELATSALSRDATRIMYIPRDTVALADSSMIGLNMPDINRRIWFGALKSWRGKAIINVNYSSGSIRVYQVESKNLGFEGKQIGELYKAFPEGSILKYSAIDIPPGDVNSVTIFWQTYNG